jgi:hypothetical protein
MTIDDAGIPEYSDPARTAEQITEIHAWVQELRSSVAELRQLLTDVASAPQPKI